MVQTFATNASTFTYPQITDEHAAFYRENGYLIVDDALSMEEVEALRRETVAICRGERGKIRNGFKHSPDDTDDEVTQRYLCIHFPHKISEVMLRYLAHPVIGDLLTSASSPNVKWMQSVVFVNTADKPAQPWHQDEDSMPTRDS